MLLPSHYLWSLNCVVFAQACQTQSVWPAMLSIMIKLFSAMLCAGICDQRWKWLQSFVISSSKHEMCFRVFHPSSLLHFRAQSQRLKGDGMQEVKITLFNANSRDKSWSSTLLSWYQCLIGHLALPSPPLAAAAEVWSRSCWLGRKWCPRMRFWCF